MHIYIYIYNKHATCERKETSFPKTYNFFC